MVDTIFQILTWAIPSGGVGAAIAWMANRKVKAAESAKQVHDTYKSMYEDISRELLTTQKKVDESTRENAKAIDELNKENARTRYALNRLSRAIEAIQLCPSRGTCPVRIELQNSEDDAENPDGGAKKRQQRKRKSEGGNQPNGDKGNVDTAHRERHDPPEVAHRPDSEAAQGGGVREQDGTCQREGMA